MHILTKPSIQQTMDHFTAKETKKKANKQTTNKKTTTKNTKKKKFNNS